MKAIIKMFGALGICAVSASTLISCNIPKSDEKKYDDSKVLINTVLTNYNLKNKIYTGNNELPTEKQLKDKIKEQNMSVDVSHISIKNIKEQNALVISDEVKYSGEIWIYYHTRTNKQIISKKLKSTEISYKNGESFDTILDLNQATASKNIILEQKGKIIAQSTTGWNLEWNTKAWRNEHLIKDQYIKIISTVAKEDVILAVNDQIQAKNKYFASENLKLEVNTRDNKKIWGSISVEVLEDRAFDKPLKETSGDYQFGNCLKFIKLTELKSRVSINSICLPEDKLIKFKFRLEINNKVN